MVPSPASQHGLPARPAPSPPTIPVQCNRVTPTAPPRPLTWCSRSSISVSARRRPRHCRGPKPKAREGILVPEPLLSNQRWG